MLASVGKDVSFELKVRMRHVVFKLTEPVSALAVKQAFLDFPSTDGVSAQSHECPNTLGRKPPED